MRPSSNPFVTIKSGAPTRRLSYIHNRVARRAKEEFPLPATYNTKIECWGSDSPFAFVLARQSCRPTRNTGGDTNSELSFYPGTKGLTFPQVQTISSDFPPGSLYFSSGNPFAGPVWLHCNESRRRLVAKHTPSRRPLPLL